MISRTLRFIKEAKVELSKVTWLTKQQVINYSVLVIVISILIAVFLGSLDYFFGILVDQFIL